MSERPVVEIAIFTDQAEQVLAFYGRLLPVGPEAEWPGGAIFPAGNAKVLVHERSRGMVDAPPNEDHFALGVEDLDGACAELRAQGVELLVEPRDYPWGRSAYLRDPEGRLVELLQS